ncbi:MAG: ABC transporter ATP-binding protein [archaeon]
MAKDPVLRIQHITKRFGKKRILKDISFEVYEGEILGIIGSSGSGKTTLLRTMTGFFGPDEGDVLFRSDNFMKKISRNPAYASIYGKHKVAKNLFGFASQTPSFYEKLTVRENLMYFGSLYNLTSKALRSNIEILLALFDLKHAEHTLGEKLSGGMERRLDMACALIHDPEILVLDEPTSDLDPVLREHIWSLVQKINKRGTTVILASHHLNEVENFCSRIAIIKDGSLIELETPARLKAKHSSSQKIVIETYPGNYSNIVKSFKKPGAKAFDAQIKGSELVLFSDQSKIVLHELLHTLDTLGEELIDIRISRPGLDELFLKITEKGKKNDRGEN